MSHIKLKYIHQFRDRHGKPRHYVRLGGRRVPLPGLPGSSEYMTAYSAALDEAPKRAEIGVTRTVAGSVNAVIVGYLKSGDFTNLAPSSQVQYRRIFEGLRREHGDKRMATIEGRHVVSMLNAKAATPSAARDFLRCLRLLVKYAISTGIRQDDPTAGVWVKMTKSDGFRTWTEADIAAFETAYPLVGKPRLALALLLETGLRCSDVVRVGRANIGRDGVLRIVQQKSSIPVANPVNAKLAEAINAAAPADHLVFLINEHGRAFTAKSFGKWFSAQCDRIGLVGLSPHGVRKLAATRMANAGATTHELMAFFGWASLKEAERYTRRADRERLARSGAQRTEQQHGLANPAAESGKPGEKGR